MDLEQLLGESVTVIIDRPLGTTHPNHNDIIYPVNYGYIENIFAGDGEEQDAYILGVDEKLNILLLSIEMMMLRIN